MRLLIDTQIALWMSLGDARLSKQTLKRLTAPKTTRLFSAASAWEIAVKWRLGKLPLPHHPREWIDRMIRELVLSALPMRHDHAVQAADLPDHHRDPFDRILIAQAQVEGVAIVSSDGMFEKYEVELLPA